MKKSILLVAVCLALGWGAAQAQEKAPKAPQKKIRIILKENGESKMYEYNSVEEMQADERLKGKNIPMMQAEDLRIRISENKDRERFLITTEVDTFKVNHFRQFFEKDSGDHKMIFLRKHTDNKDLEIFRSEQLDPTALREMHVFNTAPIVREELSEEMRKVLIENGLNIKEGEKVVILRMNEAIPVPPAPPAPGMVPVPPMPTPAEPAPDWLEELTVSPNPASEQLRVQFKSAAKGAAVLRLRDMNGKVVYEEKIADGNKRIDKTIKTPVGKKGLYLLQIEQNGKTYTNRVYLK